MSMTWLIKIQQSFKLLSLFWQAFIAGSLMGLGLIIPGFFLVTFVGIILFFWSCRQVVSVSGAFWLGFVSWCTKSLVSLVFMWQMFPIYWLDAVGYSSQLFLIGINWFLSAVAFGVAGALVSVAYYFLQQKFKRYRYHVFVPILVSVLWVLGEVTGSLLFSIIFLGPGTLIQNYFTYGYVGYALAAIPGVWYASVIAGVYGLGLLIVTFSYTIALIPKIMVSQMAWRLGGVGIITLILAGVLYSPQYPTGVTVASIDTQFRGRGALASPGGEAHIIALHEAVSASLDKSVDYVLLPEDARYYERLPLVASTLESPFDAYGSMVNEAVVIDTARTQLTDGRNVLRASYYSRGSLIASSDKDYLTPQGEYISYWLRGLLIIAGKGALLTLPNVGNYSPGPLVTPTNKDGVPILDLPPTLFCFESTNPIAGYQKIKQSPEAPFIFHPVSHSWFYNAHVLTYQLDMKLRVQAQMSGVPIISAVSMGTGKVYFPNGQIGVIPPSVEGDGWAVRVVKF